MQNFAPAGFGAWHEAHTGPEEACWGGGLPCGCPPGRGAAGRGTAGTALTVGDTVLGRGLLRGLGLRGLLGLCLLRAERAGEPESGTEECPVGRAAALGHALARAERHLAGRVVLEAAGQLGVTRVLGQLLELLLVLGGQVDVEVAHPGQLHAVGDELAVGGVDRGLLDLRGVRHQAQDRPAVADDLGGDVGPQHLEQLVAHPAGDPLVVGDVDRGGHVGHQPHRIGHPHRVVAEHP